MNNLEFEVIYKKYSQIIYQTAYSYTKDIDISKDVVQETFLKLLKYNKKFNDQEHQKNWLIRVCVNLSIEYLRKNKRIVYSEEFIRNVKEEEEELSRSEYINLLVSKLPIKYRSVIILYYYEDNSIKQISKILNIRESAVKMRMLRGKQKLIEMEKKYDK